MPHRVAVFTQDFEAGTVYVLPFESSHGCYSYPLAFPLDVLWIMNLLSLGRGVMIHACGVDTDGRGMVFAGPSGAGKSTLAKLWNKYGNATVLSDERVILRRVGGRFVVYGTPWGSVVDASSEGVSLSKVFFIQHANHTFVKRMKEKEAVIDLLTQSFSALYDPAGMQYTLDFCTDLIKEVPCYELGFVPDESVLDFVRCLT